MRILHEHPWRVSPQEGMAIQRELGRWVVAEDRLGPVRTVGGVDVSAQRGMARAAVVTLSFPELVPLESSVATLPLEMPYIPGLLSFREAPAILAALERLSALPDLLIVDGQGIAHPRRLGIAAHLGALLDHPAIGCAKSRLCGTHDEPGWAAGSQAPLRDGGETIGAVVRTRTGVRPVYVSVGHRLGLETAIRYVLACCTRYRLPETTRWAHRVAGGELIQEGGTWKTASAASRN